MSAVRTAPALLADDGRASLASRLRVLLLAMEYQAFARCICALLEAIGYEDARPAGRAEWKGYNRPGGGGYDLEANIPGGLAPRRMVAQIKQFDSLNVHQRSVDELRGACLRAGASEALLVTTSAFSEVVRKAALSPDPAGGLVAPVRLIGGEELLALIVRHRIGVRQGGRRFCRKCHARTGVFGTDGLDKDGLNTDGLEIDEAFFRGLAGPARPAAPRRERPTLPVRGGWRITVQVFSRPFFQERHEGRTSDRDGGNMEGGR